MLEFVKHHPYMSAGAVFVVGVVFVLALSGGSDAASAPAGVVGSDSATAANTAIAMKQLDLAAQTNMSAQAATVENNRTAAQVAMAQLSADVAKTNVALQADTQKYLADADARIQTTQIATQQAIALSNNQTQAAIAANNNSTQSLIMGMSADVQKHLADVNSATQLGLAQTISSAQIEQQKVAAAQQALTLAQFMAPQLYATGAEWQSYFMLDNASKALQAA